MNRLSKSDLPQLFSVSLSFKATPSLLTTLHFYGFGLVFFSFLPVMAVDSDLKHSEWEFPSSVCGSVFVDSVSHVLSCDIWSCIHVTSSTAMFTV